MSAEGVGTRMTVVDSEFERAWVRQWGLVPPLAHIMRKRHSEQWLRLHSLPRSKRYADTEAEYCEILHRHNTAISLLIPQGMRYLHLWPDWYHGSSAFGEAYLPAEAERRVVAVLEDPNYYDKPVTFYAEPRYWTRGSIDDELLRVARDEIRFAMFEPCRGVVFAPYDGGADLFVPGIEERNHVRLELGDWVPAAG